MKQESPDLHEQLKETWIKEIQLVELLRQRFKATTWLDAANDRAEGMADLRDTVSRLNALRKVSERLQAQWRTKHGVLNQELGETHDRRTQTYAAALAAVRDAEDVVRQSKAAVMAEISDINRNRTMVGAYQRQ